MLKVAVYENSYWVHQCAIKSSLKSRPDCLNPGLVAEVFLSILTFLNQPYELITYEKPSVGEFFNDSWHDGLFQELQDGEIDVIANLWVETELRHKKFSFSYPIDQLKIIFMIAGGQKDLASSYSLLSQPFTTRIWIYLILSVSLFCLLFAFYMIFKGKSWEFNKVVHKSQFRGLKLSWILFGLVTLFFSQLYASSLLTYLLRNPMKQMVDDQDHMIKLISTGEIKILTNYGDDFVFQLIHHSSHPYFRKLRKAVELNPPVIEPEYDKYVQLFGTGNYVVMNTEDEIVYFKKTWCNLQIVITTGLPDSKLAVMVRKDTKLEKEMNWAVLNRYGRIETIVDRYKGHELNVAEGNCASTLHPQEGRKALELAGLTGAFVVYGVCILVTCLIFVAEHLEVFIKKRKVRRQNPLASQIESFIEMSTMETEVSNLTEEQQKDFAKILSEGPFASFCKTALQDEIKNWKCEMLEQESFPTFSIEPDEFIVCGPCGVRFRMKPPTENYSNWDRSDEV